MSNLFGGLFEASQRVKEQRLQAKKDAEKKEKAKLAAAAKAKAEAAAKKSNKAEKESGKRKKEADEDMEDMEDSKMPSKKKSKLSENAGSNGKETTSKPSSHIAALISKTSKKKKKHDSDSESEDSFDSNRSVLEFGSDDEVDEKLIAEVQNIIDTGNAPEEEEEDSGSESSEQEEEQVHSVFVGNLLPNISKEELSNLVREIEEPTNVRVLMQDRSGRKVAVAFLDFKKAATVSKVVKKFHNSDFKGRKLQLRPANDRKLAPAPVNGESVYIRNLSYETSEETLRKLFSSCGEILQIRLPLFADSGKHKGYGFIDFKDSTSAKKAIKLDRKKIDGRPIIVEPAEKRQAPKVESLRKDDWEGEHLSFDD